MIGFPAMIWRARLACLILGHRWQYPWGPDRRRCARCLRRECATPSGEWGIDLRPRASYPRFAQRHVRVKKLATYHPH
jgi:hypothetical protein